MSHCVMHNVCACVCDRLSGTPQPAGQLNWLCYDIMVMQQLANLCPSPYPPLNIWHSMHVHYISSWPHKANNEILMTIRHTIITHNLIMISQHACVIAFFFLILFWVYQRSRGKVYVVGTFVYINFLIISLLPTLQQLFCKCNHDCVGQFGTLKKNVLSQFGGVKVLLPRGWVPPLVTIDNNIQFLMMMWAWLLYHWIITNNCVNFLLPSLPSPLL